MYLIAGFCTRNFMDDFKVYSSWMKMTIFMYNFSTLKFSQKYTNFSKYFNGLYICKYFSRIFLGILIKYNDNVSFLSIGQHFPTFQHTLRFKTILNVSKIQRICFGSLTDNVSCIRIFKYSENLIIVSKKKINL